MVAKSERVLIQQILVFLQIITLVQGAFFINTWPFKGAAETGWATLKKTGSAMDAVVEGCSRCERDQCDTTVGYGGSPDENGIIRLDAMVMDGNTMEVGAVASLPEIKDAIKVARSVLEHTTHTLIVGESARDFAISMGFERSNLTSSDSTNLWKNWLKKRCQPNFRKNVTPDPKQNCGPYQPINNTNNINNNIEESIFSAKNHDTIGAVAIDARGHIVAGTSTNGAKFKIPGRVGDSPIAGSGAYADSEVGGATATGNGDVMMRFLPSFLAVELMRIGLSPANACQVAVDRIKKFYPTFRGAVIAANKDKEFGAACNGLTRFEFMVMRDDFEEIRKYHVDC